MAPSAISMSDWAHDWEDWLEHSDPRIQAAVKQAYLLEALHASPDWLLQAAYALQLQLVRLSALTRRTAAAVYATYNNTSSWVVSLGTAGFMLLFIVVLFGWVASRQVKPTRTKESEKKESEGLRRRLGAAADDISVGAMAIPKHLSSKLNDATVQGINQMDLG
eukprot:CAMPEP_0182597518 /NCGR_PEP_ID=MMETSP1324-20130603/86428_1 /TAXON_ID=236786 /ORGANISM="Florenciella sp., Strain RCC1587" /LENGTH=163 /DNA_ID=CAMNT_0024815275 /DNA_START=136 /DNA_END=623 /DNA_ORIENTATION=-